MTLELRTSRQADHLLGLGPAHEEARSRVARVLEPFAEPDELMPEAERHRLLRTIVGSLGADGVLGGIVARELGGAGMSYSELAAAVEEASARAQVVASLLAFASASIGTVLTAHGTQEQIEQYLLPTLRGQHLAAMGFTEPAGGSDVANMTTVAEPVHDGFVLQGEKVWVDWAPETDWFLIFAQADPAAGRRGISAFLLPREWPGVTTSSMGRKLGFREYTTGRIELSGCRIPASALLGEVGQGLAIARTALEDARVYVAARLCGSLALCLHWLRRHASDRALTRSDQLFCSTVTDVATDLDAARFLMYRASAAKDAGHDAGVEAMRAKLFASEALGRASSALVTVLGPDALLDSHPAARLFRDAKVSGVTAGSDEIMRGAVARGLLG